MDRFIHRKFSSKAETAVGTGFNLGCLHPVACVRSGDHLPDDGRTTEICSNIIIEVVN
jgi:hypothetical protein